MALYSLSNWYKISVWSQALKDVDIFCVLGEDESHYRSEKPSVLLSDVESKLIEKYGKDSVRSQRRSVTVEFPVGDDEERVMSFDVVPAFDKDTHYEIPDTNTDAGWTETDPEIHAEKATEANKAFDGEWKGMVRMIKRWNVEKGKPVKPSFLLEVMALDLLRPPFGGDYPYEFQTSLRPQPIEFTASGPSLLVSALR